MRHLSSSALLWLLVAPRRAVRKHAFFSRRRERREEGGSLRRSMSQACLSRKMTDWRRTDGDFSWWSTRFRLKVTLSHTSASLFVVTFVLFSSGLIFVSFTRSSSLYPYRSYISKFRVSHLLVALNPKLGPVSTRSLRWSSFVLISQPPSGGAPPLSHNFCSSITKSGLEEALSRYLCRESVKQNITSIILP